MLTEWLGRSAILCCSASVSQACGQRNLEMNEKFTGRLIRAVRNRPILYILKHPEQKNEPKKLAAWREIRNELDEDVPVLKAKWKNLKDSYKKHKLSKKSSCSNAVKKLHSWAWADHMRFLDQQDETGTTDPNDTVSSDKHREETRQTELDVTAKYKKKRRPDIPQKPQIKKRRLNEEKVEVKCDGVDLLFLGYADTFKKLSQEKQISAKFDIAKIFMEAEMSDFNDLQNAGTPEYLESDADFDDPLNTTATNIKEEMQSVEHFD